LRNAHSQVKHGIVTFLIKAEAVFKVAGANYVKIAVSKGMKQVLQVVFYALHALAGIQIKIQTLVLCSKRPATKQP